MTAPRISYSTAAIALPVLVVGLGLGLGGCTLAETSLDSPAQDLPARLPSIRLANRPIASIDSLAAEQAEETVAVAGTVVRRAALLEGWLYELRDETGSVWVLTERSEPVVGALATVQGILRYEAIAIDEIDASSVYLEEQSYRQGDG